MTAQPQSESGRGGGEDQRADSAEQARPPFPFLDELHGLETRRRERRIAAEESGTEHEMPAGGQQVRTGQPRQQPEHKRPRDIDEQRGPRCRPRTPHLECPIEEHARHGSETPGRGDGDEQQRTHSAPPSGPDRRITDAAAIPAQVASPPMTTVASP